MNRSVGWVLYHVVAWPMALAMIVVLLLAGCSLPAEVGMSADQRPAGPSREQSSDMSLSSTQTLPLLPGDTFVDLERLVGDPHAKLTLHVAQPDPTTFIISDIQVTAGPTTGSGSSTRSS